MGKKQRIVTPEMLEPLPGPVQRYLTYTGVVGCPWIDTVRRNRLPRQQESQDRQSFEDWRSLPQQVAHATAVPHNRACLTECGNGATLGL